MKDKVYSDIVDEGSCRNVISEEATNKFYLSIEKNLATYHLSWFKKGNEI